MIKSDDYCTICSIRVVRIDYHLCNFLWRKFVYDVRCSFGSFRFRRADLIASDKFDSSLVFSVWVSKTFFALYTQNMFTNHLEHWFKLTGFGRDEECTRVEWGVYKLCIPRSISCLRSGSCTLPQYSVEFRPDEPQSNPVTCHFFSLSFQKWHFSWFKTNFIDKVERFFRSKIKCWVFWITHGLDKFSL